MRYSDKVPTVNAGSMADIAFLLLIFFLVTSTIPNDKGIIRKLPSPCPPGIECEIEMKERNILRISINEKGELMANNDLVAPKDLLNVLKKFIDNNGDASCQYCLGAKLKESSENPQLATIALTAHRNAPYSMFIAVQDELSRAYFELRESYVKTILKRNVATLSTSELAIVQQAYPFRITEATTR